MHKITELGFSFRVAVYIEFRFWNFWRVPLSPSKIKNFQKMDLTSYSLCGKFKAMKCVVLSVAVLAVDRTNCLAVSSKKKIQRLRNLGRNNCKEYTIQSKEAKIHGRN
jgi:hypothetical protein